MGWADDSTAVKAWKIIGIGFIGALVLYVAAFALEFLACFFSCGQAGLCVGEPIMLPIWTGSAFGGTFAVLSIAGIVIGIIYAITVNVQKNSEEREKLNLEQRQKYAVDFQKEYGSAIEQCGNHLSIIGKTKLHPNYEAVTLQEDLWNVLDDVSTLLQKLDIIAGELR